MSLSKDKYIKSLEYRIEELEKELKLLKKHKKNISFNNSYPTNNTDAISHHIIKVNTEKGRIKC